MVGLRETTIYGRRVYIHITHILSVCPSLVLVLDWIEYTVTERIEEMNESPGNIRTDASNAEYNITLISLNKTIIRTEGSVRRLWNCPHSWNWTEKKLEFRPPTATRHQPSSCPMSFSIFDRVNCCPRASHNNIVHICKLCNQRQRSSNQEEKKWKTTQMRFTALIHRPPNRTKKSTTSQF